MRRQPHVDRLVGVAAPIGRLQHLGVAPDLGFRQPSRRPRRCRPPCQVFSPHFTVEPTVRSANCRDAARPAMISFLPGSNFRPSTIFTFGADLERLRRHAAQRHVRVGPVRLQRVIHDDEQLRRRQRAVRRRGAMPGVSWMIRRVDRRVMPLVISVSLPGAHHHDRVCGSPTRLHRASEAFGDRQHRRRTRPRRRRCR